MLLNLLKCVNMEIFTSLRRLLQGRRYRSCASRHGLHDAPYPRDIGVLERLHGAARRDTIHLGLGLWGAESAVQLGQHFAEMVHFFRVMQHQIAAQVIGSLAFAHGRDVHQRHQQFADETFGRRIHISQPKAAAKTAVRHFTY